jgi:hypothetical protein
MGPINCPETLCKIAKYRGSQSTCECWVGEVMRLYPDIYCYCNEVLLYVEARVGLSVALL